MKTKTKTKEWLCSPRDWGGGESKYGQREGKTLKCVSVAKGIYFT